MLGALLAKLRRKKKAAPPAAPSSAAPAPAHGPSEYAPTGPLPSAGRTGALGEAPEFPDIFPGETPRPAPAARAPWREKLPDLKYALVRGALLGGALVASFALFANYDGLTVIQRERALSAGTQEWAVIEDVAPAPRAGLLQYKLTFSAEDPRGPKGAVELVGEPARVLAIRGRRVAVRRAVLDGKELVVLVDDYGFSAQRAALLLALIGFLLVGAWSLAFRVL